MGFGGTTRKLQKVASMAEDVYAKLNEMRQQLVELNETVDRIDRRTNDNRALIERLAEQEGIDVEAVLAETAIEEAESTGGDRSAGAGPASGDADAGDESGTETADGEADGSDTDPGTDAGTTSDGR